MAGVADMTVRVGADISGLSSGINDATALMDKLKAGTAQLSREIKSQTAEYSKNEKELSKLLTAQKNAIGTSSDYYKNLTAKIAGLTDKNKQLGASIDDNKKVFDQGNNALKSYNQSLSAQEREHEKLGNSLKKFTNVNELASEGLGRLRRQAVSLAEGGLLALGSIITGVVISAFADWYDMINKVSEATKTAQANQKNLNEIFADSNKEAAKQITSLKILYDAATNVNLSMKDRLAAVKGLQNEFPDYFKNIKAEAILNGSSKSAYDALTESIIKTARAKAAIDKLNEIGGKQLDNDIQRQKILNATTNEAARAQDRVLKSQTSGSSLTGGGASGGDVTITRAEQLKVIQARRDAALKIVEINNKSLKDQAEFITKFIGLSDLAKSAETEIKAPKVAKDKTSIKNVETIADVLAKLGIQIDFLNQKELLLKVSQSKEKINAIEGAVNTLMQKFKLLADSPIILKLEARIQDIQLQEEFKKVLKFDKSKPFAEIPYELQILMQKPTVEFPPGTFDEQILRDQILKKLADLGIKKTIPISIGVDITGQNINAGSESITKNTSTDKLSATLKNALSDIKSFNNAVSSELNNLNASILEGVGTALGNAFSGQGDVLKGLFDSIFSTLGSALQQLGKVAIQTGIGIKAIQAAFKSLNPFVAIAAGVGLIALGTIIKNSIGQIGGFATGGYIKGPGTRTSDSIMARLSAGEFVIKADTVSKFGLGFFEKLNSGMMPKFDKFGLAKFAQGGFVSPNIIGTQTAPQLSAISITGGQTVFIADSRLRGQDIVTAFKRASSTIARNS